MGEKKNMCSGGTLPDFHYGNHWTKNLRKSLSHIYVCVWMCVCVHTQSCPTLCSPMDCSPLSSSAHGTFQARILEWGTIYYSRGSSRLGDQTHISCVSCIGRWILYQLCHLGSHSAVHSFIHCLWLLLGYNGSIVWPAHSQMFSIWPLR